MFLTIIIVLVSIMALLVIHELGHFIMAKKFKVGVEEFGIGLPPKLLSKKVGETIYSLNLLPFGAFVKIHGEEDGAEDSGSFIKKPIWQRALILLAGVVSFWIVGIILLTIVLNLGAFQAISDEDPASDAQVQIIAIAAGSPADQAGLKSGDFLKELKIPQDGLEINKVIEVQEFTQQYKGEEIILLIGRGKETFETSLTPRAEPPQGEGAMGVSLARVAKKSYPFFQAFIKAIETTFNLTIAIIVGLFGLLLSLITGQGLPPGIEVMGPIGIGSMAVQAVQVGLSYFLQFIALIAIYLAIFNLLPIPALDGGKLLFLAIEKIKGSPINRKFEQRITVGFFLALIFLMILVTIKDIAGLF